MASPRPRGGSLELIDVKGTRIGAGENISAWRHFG